jgi:membrane protease YdiL (CAAX protease family)
MGRLMAAKARAWSVILGGAAAVSFLFLSAGVPHASPWELLGVGLLVVAGAMGMTWLAVALACQAADLSDEQRGAIGPGTIYLFLLVGGLYNVVLAGDAEARLRGVALYLFACSAYWVSGMDQALVCLDPDARRRRALAVGDAATFALLAYLGQQGAAAAARMAAADHSAERWVALARAGVLIVIGLSAALHLARKTPALARMGVATSGLIALGAGTSLGAVLRALPSATGTSLLLGGDGGGGAIRALAVSTLAVSILFEELIFRGIVQRALEERWGSAFSSRGGGRLLAAGVAALVAAVASFGGPFGLVFAVSLTASLVRAATGRTAAALVARLTASSLALG